MGLNLSLELVPDDACQMIVEHGLSPVACVSPFAAPVVVPGGTKRYCLLLTGLGMNVAATAV
jgi:hypothetical protein